ncbi:hypothetical protein ACEWY4_014537 [Coilia grayii]|uniref:PEX5-related protein n=1 Tax=Coilia grayii TaxID=363190 RepID=A0ABD1JSJ2_9TELE
MVMKEMPAMASPEGKPLLTVTTKLVREQQESRPLLSLSIDDFLCETKSHAIAIPRPVTSNTAVLSSSLDLLDLSDVVGERRNSRDRKCSLGDRKSSLGDRKCSLGDRKSPLTLRPEGSKVAVHRKRSVETDLIQVDVEQNTTQDTGNVPSPLEKWEELNVPRERSGSRKWKLDKRRPSKHSSSELLWTLENKGPLDVSSKHTLEVNTKADADASPTTQSDTEFWDKMQAEWEELARRNWLTDDDTPQIPPSVCPMEKGYYFHTDNPYKDWANAFEEGVRRGHEGDLPNAVLLLEAAVLQDPQDSEAWQVLGTTQAENENEQAAIVSLQRCLELHPNNLAALLALAVSLTNTGMRQDACGALLRWLRHNPKYKHLLKGRTHLLPPSPLTQRRMSRVSNNNTSSLLPDVKELFLEAAQQSDVIDPDLQTALGVLYNLSHEFNKAVDAFNAALSVRPEDYLLWNRLGATLANGNRSEEAVEAYTRALELQPGFIRSRYNLGISCINMGAHREAATNFLTALSLQRKSGSRQLSHQVTSGSIWSALRVALSLMDQPELFQAANIGDLDMLMRAFHLDI